jgi:hypothetical protein
LFSDKNFTITGPTAALNLIETHTEITCIGADGICSALQADGQGGYEYEVP